MFLFVINLDDRMRSVGRRRMHDIEKELTFMTFTFTHLADAFIQSDFQD